VNEQLKKALDSMIRNLESRKQSERLMILGLLMAGIGMIYLSVAYDPLRANIDNITSRIASVERQIQAQQSSYQEMLRQSQEDPNRFINDRLIVLQREQVELDRQIQALAGDLVTPNQMTEILTTVLERQQ
jgi:MSHA biogenesis protein MshJ